MTRAEACERACAGGCERAAAGAEASADAGEACALACAEACERRADANGKFEVTLTRGSEEMRRWEEAIASAGGARAGGGGDGWRSWSGTKRRGAREADATASSEGEWRRGRVSGKASGEAGL